jgi:hypothetical protein
VAVLTIDVGGAEEMTLDCEKGGHAAPRKVGQRVYGFAGVETSSERAELMVVPVILAPLPTATVSTIRALFALGAQVPCEGDIFNRPGEEIVCSGKITDELHEVGDRWTVNLTLYEVANDDTATPVGGAGPEAGADPGSEGGDPPTGASALMNWYDAQALVGLSDEDPLTTWPDESGNNFDAPAGNASFPGYYDTNVMNTFPAVRFSALGNNQRGYDLPNDAEYDAIEVFVVLRRGASGGGALWHFGETVTGPNVPMLSSNTFRDNFASTVARSFSPLNIDPQEPFLYHVRARNGEWKCWVNGVLRYSTSANTLWWDSGPQGTKHFGMWLSGGSFYTEFLGWIGELKIYENFMSSAAAAAEEAALMTKWGIP